MIVTLFAIMLNDGTIKKTDVTSLKWAAIVAVNISPTYQS